MSEISLQPLINALPTLLGVMLGALGAYYSSKKIKNIELQNARSQELRIEKRKCCAEFLSESNRQLMKSFDSNFSSASEFSNLANCCSNVELLCSEATISSMKEILSYVLKSHSSSRKNEDYSKYNELRAAFIVAIKKELET
jgi:hypothetical protein